MSSSGRSGDETGRDPAGPSRTVNPAGRSWRYIADHFSDGKAGLHAMVPAMTAPLTAQTRDCDLIDESRTRPEAFAALFDRYSAMLYDTSPGGWAEIAEDLVGETFLVAFARRDTTTWGIADARPWLFGIATRIVSRHHRTEAARYRALRRSPVDLAVESPADRVARGHRAGGRPGARPRAGRAPAGTATSCCSSPGAT